MLCLPDWSLEARRSMLLLEREKRWDDTLTGLSQSEVHKKTCKLSPLLLFRSRTIYTITSWDSFFFSLSAQLQLQMKMVSAVWCWQSARCEWNSAVSRHGRRCETEKLFPARKNHRTHRSQAIQRVEFAARHTNRSKWNFPSWYGRAREGKFFTLNNFLRHKTTLTFDILLCVTAEKWRMGFAHGNDFSSKLWVGCRCQPYLLLVLEILLKTMWNHEREWTLWTLFHAADHTRIVKMYFCARV